MDVELSDWILEESRLKDRSGGLIFVNGSSGAGKTHLMEHLLTVQGWARMFDKVVLLSTTHKWSKASGDFKCFTYDKDSFMFSKERFESIVNEWKLKNHDKSKTGGAPKRLLVILDDILNLPKRDIDLIKWAAIAGRHFGVLVCVLTQSLAKSAIAAPMIRPNVVTIITSFCARAGDKQTILEEFLLGRLPPGTTKVQASELFDKYTQEKHSFIVLDLLNTSRRTEEVVFKYPQQPENLPDVKISSIVGSRAGGGGMNGAAESSSRTALATNPRQRHVLTATPSVDQSKTQQPPPMPPSLWAMHVSSRK